MKCRLIIDEPAGGAWNMAVDQVLVDTAAAGNRWTLRLYQWDRATLSLGYFQPHTERASHPASAACSLVRRTSGGGAILHDRELTYCLAVPEAHPLAREAAHLYRVVHGSLVEAVGRLGVAAGIAPAAERARPEPFLCFQRHAPGDVLVAGHKVAGSAQRRRRGAIMQHGSIVLAASRAAPELPGLSELAGRPISAKDLQTAWLNLLKNALGVAFSCEALEAGEMADARRLEQEKFGSLQWTLRR